MTAQKGTRSRPGISTFLCEEPCYCGRGEGFDFPAFRLLINILCAIYCSQFTGIGSQLNGKERNSCKNLIYVCIFWNYQHMCKTYIQGSQKGRKEVYLKAIASNWKKLESNKILSFRLYHSILHIYTTSPTVYKHIRICVWNNGCIVVLQHSIVYGTYHFMPEKKNCHLYEKRLYIKPFWLCYVVKIWRVYVVVCFPIFILKNNFVKLRFWVLLVQKNLWELICCALPQRIFLWHSQESWYTFINFCVIF